MDIKEIVKEKYGQAALRVSAGGSSCCGASASFDGCWVDPITSNLYDANQTGQIPVEAVLASLGCGNPTALAQLNAGETVLDLGSGGGIDVLLSARGVGSTGKAYGLDMTDELKEMWVGCIAGALHDDEYIGSNSGMKAGFGSIGIEPARVYSIEDARQFSPARAST